MLALAGQVAKPPELAAAVLILGEGLALVAAITFMAAVYERNVVAQRSQEFTSWALGIACVSALLVVFGTVETLDIKSTLVTVTVVVSLALVLVAVRIAFDAPSVPRGTVKCEKTTGDVSPKRKDQCDGQGETAVQMAEVPQSRPKDIQGEHIAPEQDSVVDGEVPKPLPERGER
jgi:hypothetical protein